MGTAALVLGLAVVAAPFVIVFGPDLMPGAVIVTSFFPTNRNAAIAGAISGWHPSGCNGPSSASA